METPAKVTVETLDVEVILPPAPYTVASVGFLSTLLQVEEQVAALKIANEDGAQLAANLMTRLTDAGNKLDATRLELKRPFINASKAIDDAAKAPGARIETAKSTLKRALTAFATAEETRAREVERARQAELARLEEVRLEEERAAREKAAKMAAEAAARVPVVPPPTAQPVWDDEDGPAEEAPPPPKTATEEAIEAVKYAPAVVPVKPTGVRFKVALVPSVVDLRAVPDHFVERIVKIGAIKATFCSGWKEGDAIPVCPGIKFEVSKTAESTGRSVF